MVSDHDTSFLPHLGWMSWSGTLSLACGRDRAVSRVGGEEAQLLGSVMGPQGVPGGVGTDHKVCSHCLPPCRRFATTDSRVEVSASQGCR